MKIELPSQLIIDETVEDILTERYKPSVWIENAFKAKRSAGRFYFTSPPEAFFGKPTRETVFVRATISEPIADSQKLRDRIAFLEMQLESHRPYLQLFRLGAGGLFLSIISLVVWLITGYGIPFHPMFAAGGVPTALGVIAMAFLIRPRPSK